MILYEFTLYIPWAIYSNPKREIYITIRKKVNKRYSKIKCVKSKCGVRDAHDLILKAGRIESYSEILSKIDGIL